jgi:glycosyltransferase involved in cell wall biosynthesis
MMQMQSGRLRIAVFLYGPTRGGATRRGLTLAEGFASRGHEVDLVMARRDGPLAGRISPRLRVVDLSGGMKPPRLLRHRRIRTRFCVAGLERYLRRERPDVLLAGSTAVHLAALRAHRRARVDTGLVLRACSHLSSVSLSTRRLPRPLQLVSAHLHYGRATAAIAVSEDVAEDLARVTTLPRERIHVVPNPVIPPDLEKSLRGPLEHAWFGDGGPPLVLSAGRLARQKDFATLLRAFALLRQRRPARLVILGEANGGTGREELERLALGLGIAEQVSLPGMVDNPFGYMARADVFALSSAWEGMPGVLIEAMASGCPVVSTDCPGGSREILEDGELGALVPVGDAAALAEALDKTLDSPVDAGRLRSRASAFGVDASVERYLSVLYDAAPAQRPQPEAPCELTLPGGAAASAR